MDPDTSAVQSVIALQYNRDSLSRTLQIQAVQGGGQEGVRVGALRLRGPAVETIKIEAHLDATDQPEFLTQSTNAADRKASVGLESELSNVLTAQREWRSHLGPSRSRKFGGEIATANGRRLKP
ncbi:MAG TPA: hypothetical protein VH639_08715 [Bryobacteraceae bacterium]|jgi:hypothetical protein